MPPLLLHLPVAPWAVAGDDGLELVLLVAADFSGEVYARTLPDNEERLEPMRRDGSQGPAAAWQRWRARVPWNGADDLTLYSFVAHGAAGARWLAADAVHALVPPEAVHFRVHRSAAPPAWVRDQVFYQVFPDRFARAAASGPPADRRGEQLLGADRRPVVQVPWGAPIDRRHAANTFHGGDLPGVIEKLPYLHDELGASAIWLNPVFAAGSNHRYDTSDYTQVDPHLGGNAALAALRAATRERGMRLVLDAVVNHTGADHPWFDRWGRHGGDGAASSPRSPFRERYVFDAHGHAHGWKGHDSLPVLDYASPAVQRAIYGDDDAVLRRWLREPYAIDGWRLDVVHMLGEGAGARNNLTHVQAIRRAIKAVNPEAYVLGEHFFEATRWLQGEPEDGAMNYHGFAWPLRAWLAGQAVVPAAGGGRARIATADFVAALVRALAAIPYANQLAQLNLLDSHDTPRLFSELDGDVARMRLAATLLFTWPGVPSIYYGDEIGLAGGADPDNRRCFDWDRAHWVAPLFEHYRRLARTRRGRRDWCEGATVSLGHGDDWLAYLRCTADAATLVAANRGDATRIALPLAALPVAVSGWRPLDGGAVRTLRDHLEIDLPATGATVLLSR